MTVDSCTLEIILLTYSHLLNILSLPTDRQTNTEIDLYQQAAFAIAYVADTAQRPLAQRPLVTYRKLEKLLSIEDRGQTDHVTRLPRPHALDFAADAGRGCAAPRQAALLRS